MPYIISSGESSEGIVLENDTMTVLDSGVAMTTTVNSEGRLYVSSGGTASGTTVESGGILYVSSGATMAGLAADSGACLNFYVAPGTYIAGTYNGSDFVIGDGAVSHYTVNENCKIYVSSGCTADVITVNSNGELRIRGGASANGVTVKGGASVELKFGTGTTPSDAEQFAALSDAGAFDAFTSRKIFEESGTLASL